MAASETRDGGGVYTFYAFRADLRSGELTKHGIRIKLQEKPFQILVYLLAHAGDVVTRDDLRATLWGSDTYVDFDHSLNIAMNKLREALSDSADSPRYIETLPRRGYRFVAQVSGNGQSNRAEATASPLISLPEPAEPPHKTRSRWLWACVAGLAAVALATLLAFRHTSAFGTRSLEFHARDWALVTQFENRTEEPIFNGTVEAALARELTNSLFVNVVPRERTNDTLELMRLPTSTAVDAAIGRELCLRDGGIRALIAGRVEKFGSAYVLSAQLVDPTSGRAVDSFEEVADGQAGTLRAVHALSNDVRQALGQKLAEIQQNDLDLQKVTTPSLKALQLYSQADEQIRNDKQPAAFELLRHAIDEDPNFASAYILAAYALWKQNLPPDEFMPFAKRALELSGQTSEAERYFVEGSYYEMMHEPDKAVSAYEALLKVNPGHFWGLKNLFGLYASQSRMQQIVELSVHHADIEPNSFDRNWGAGFALLLVSAKPDLARPYFQRANELLSTMRDRDRTKFVWEALWLQLYPAFQAWMRDDVALARAELDRAEQNPVARDGITDPMIFAGFRQALGETRKAREWLEQASAPSGRSSSEGFEDFASVAFLCGDHTAARNWLQRTTRYRVLDMPLLIREGMLREANVLAQRQKEWLPQFRNVALGELLLAQGKTVNGTRLLSDGLIEQRNHAYPSYFFGADSLARAYEKTGNVSAAIEVLESASANRIRVYGPAVMSSATLWMRDQMDLAGLYRRLDRVQDAERIEDELRKLLAYADPDYPMLLELRRLQSSPSLADSRN
ncbi:MAG TPA: winged helix-turn-helix domain-containing protein [Candidatus Acidoferrum sp.]|nr:winged helix-turn-helix domain-containing protein [Candidatus Acidoferrum sp.]